MGNEKVMIQDFDQEANQAEWSAWWEGELERCMVMIDVTGYPFFLISRDGIWTRASFQSIQSLIILMIGSKNHLSMVIPFRESGSISGQEYLQRCLDPQ